MELTTQNIIQMFFKHLHERNLKDLTDLFSDKIDWYIPGDETKAPWLGRRSNKQEISDFYELLWKSTEPISVKVESVIIDNNVAVIAGEFSTRMLKTNKIVDSLFFIQITIQDNLIFRYRLL